jgi:hypothetical protein
MTESREIAENLVAKHGNPGDLNQRQMRTWFATVWPDWRESIGWQQTDNIIDELMAIGRGL